MVSEERRNFTRLTAAVLRGKTRAKESRKAHELRNSFTSGTKALGLTVGRKHHFKPVLLHGVFNIVLGQLVYEQSGKW